MDSEDDDDATSWDGGDEEEDEPDHMDLDDEEEHDMAEQYSEEEEEPQSLLVTLHYRKKPHTTIDEGQVETAIVHRATHSLVVPTTDVVASNQPEAPGIPPTISPAGPAAPPAPPVLATTTPNGWPVQQPNVVDAHKVEIQQPPAEANTAPKVEGFFAPTPPYSGPEAGLRQEQPQFHSAQPDTNQQLPYSNNVPVNHPAPTWQ